MSLFWMQLLFWGSVRVTVIEVNLTTESKVRFFAPQNGLWSTDVNHHPSKKLKNKSFRNIPIFSPIFIEIKVTM